MPDGHLTATIYIYELTNNQKKNSVVAVVFVTTTATPADCGVTFCSAVTETTTTTTRKPSAPTVPRLLLRPNHIKKRMKKNRKRISKAAMRAMLM